MAESSPNRSIAERIDSICDQFEQEFRRGFRPSIETALKILPETERPGLFRALLELELELRQKGGDTPHATEYEARFPGAKKLIHTAFEALKRSPTMMSSVKITGIETSQGPIRKVAANTVGPAAPLQSLGRFEIKSVLGEGAFGTVYRARDPQLDRDVALKVPRFAGQQSREDRERFLREARAAAGLHHAHICPVHEVGTVDGRDYIVLSFIDGKPLSKILQTQPKLTDRQIAAVIRKLALALQDAHDQGIIHRDLKPANIMINRKGEPVIMDFGLARRSQSGDAQISQSGQIMGTPAYMSPEQARGDGKAVGPATDIYSLGIILYEMICGRRPFDGTVTEVIGKILHVDPPLPAQFRPQVDVRLQTICMKAIAKNPADRFESMKAFAMALAEYARAIPSGNRPDASPAVETGTEPSTNQFADLLAAISSDVESKVERAVRRADRNPRLTVWSYIAGSAVMGLIVVMGIFFFIRKDTVTVIVNIPIENINDPSLSFLLDGKAVPAGMFAAPVELKPGEHELVVNKEGKLFKKFVFNIGTSASGPVIPEDVTPETAPTLAPTPTEGFVSLFNGKDLAGWRSTPNGKANWRVEEWQLLAGNAGLDPGERCYLMTTRDDYADYHLRAEVMLDESTDSGIFIRMQPLPASVVNGNERGYEVQLNLEPRSNVHAGGLFVAPSGSEQPFAAHREERLLAKPNEWFTLDVTVRSGRITTAINGTIASDYTDPNRRFARGHIGLQYTRGLAKFRRIEIKEETTDNGWINLFNGNDFTGWNNPNKATVFQGWVVKDGAIVRDKANPNDVAGGVWQRNNLWTEGRYDDFILELEFRGAGTNTLVIRADQPNNNFSDRGLHVPMNMRGTPGNYWRLGTFYPFKSPGKEPRILDDWNRLRVTAMGSKISVDLNGETINEIDLDRWVSEQPGKIDPDLPKMLKNLSRNGHLGFNAREGQLSIRNIRIKELKDDGFSSLFNGKDLSNWVTVDGKLPQWKVENGYMEVVPGTKSIVTRENYPLDFELHAEFWLPKELDKKDQARANSGIYLHGRHEIQICDGYQNAIAKPLTACGGLFGEIAPRLNACTAPETWQTFDITYRSPRVSASKTVTHTGRLTVFHNGQKIIENEEFRTLVGSMRHNNQIGEPGPIMLQDHGSPVRFRNIRIKPITNMVVGPADSRTFNGHAYRFFPEQLSWKAAKARCESLGGHLVIIETAEENAFLAKLITDGSKVDSWIGATDEGSEGQWHWVDGRNMTWTNWFKRQNQPNNKGGVEHFGLMSNRKLVDGFIGWEWSDQPNESQSQHQPGYVCEWDVISTIAISQADDADRKAAESLLSLGGGFVKINGQDRQIRQASGLPAEPFRLTGVYFADNKTLDDKALAVLKDCVHLTELDLRSTGVTEKGLEIFRGKTNFTSLGLAYLRVTDTGLEIFKDNKGLKALFLHDTFITDKGLSLFHDCKELGTVWVGGTPVTDAGILPFRDCKFLKWLDVRATKVTREGVQTMKTALPACRVDADPNKR